MSSWDALAGVQDFTFEEERGLAGELRISRKLPHSQAHTCPEERLPKR
jgi:hypothetical protein